MDGNAESLRIEVDEDGDQRVSPDVIPEWKITGWAVRFAVLEKVTTLLGTLNFIWATAVLLGGFVKSLLRIDFWLVCFILVTEGLRILGLRGELDTSSLYSDVWFTMVKCVSAFSSFIREYSSWLLMCMSGLRVVWPDYGDYSEEGPNRIRALNIFYWVCLVESILIIIGLYVRVGIGMSPPWLVKWVIPKSLALEVKAKYGFADSLLDTVHRFYLQTYCRCLSGNIFDGLKMEFVSYSEELLQSRTDIEQLKGVQLLSALVKNNVFALERLRSIRKIRGVVEMLIDMLNWGRFKFLKQEIQRQAAEIISNLVSIDRYRILVMATPNSVESITSLLNDKNYIQNGNQDGDELSKLGLNILKWLTIDHDNRAKIGSNKGLLLKIIRLTELNDNAPECQILAIETLTNIARDEEVRESIGRIDGVLHNFFYLFFMNINEELVSKAGEALGFLSLENNHNCEIMMAIKLPRHLPNLILSLICVLKEPMRGTYAARILRNLYVYAEAKRVELKEITAASAQVVAPVMEREGIHQEAAIGLAAQIFKRMSISDFYRVFAERGAEIKRSLILKVVEVLKLYSSPTDEVPNIRRFSIEQVPNIRRFSIELLIALMEMDISSIQIMRLELKEAMEGVMKTTSVLESYSSFSGSVGLRSHTMAIPSLVGSAMELLDI